MKFVPYSDIHAAAREIANSDALNEEIRKQVDTLVSGRPWTGDVDPLQSAVLDQAIEGILTCLVSNAADTKTEEETRREVRLNELLDSSLTPGAGGGYVEVPIYDNEGQRLGFLWIDDPDDGEAVGCRHRIGAYDAFGRWLDQVTVYGVDSMHAAVEMFSTSARRKAKALQTLPTSIQ